MFISLFPNNPTGATINKEELKKWVDYANNNHSLILFDAAYKHLLKMKQYHILFMK